MPVHLLQFTTSITYQADPDRPTALIHRQDDRHFNVMYLESAPRVQHRDLWTQKICRTPRSEEQRFLNGSCMEKTQECCTWSTHVNSFRCYWATENGWYSINVSSPIESPSKPRSRIDGMPARLLILPQQSGYIRRVTRFYWADLLMYPIGLLKWISKRFLRF
jgi:hypothetical protein